MFGKCAVSDSWTFQIGWTAGVPDITRFEKRHFLVPNPDRSYLLSASFRHVRGSKDNRMKSSAL